MCILRTNIACRMDKMTDNDKQWKKKKVDFFPFRPAKFAILASRIIYILYFVVLFQPSQEKTFSSLRFHKYYYINNSQISYDIIDNWNEIISPFISIFISMPLLHRRRKWRKHCSESASDHCVYASAMPLLSLCLFYRQIE